MQRVTMSLEPSLAREFDRLAKQRGYQNRSEAMRDILREAVGELRVTALPTSACVANLSYIYDHNVRLLAKRLMAMQHEHHDIVVANTRVHLDHENCIETLILKGTVQHVQTFADAVRAERGVRFGALNLIAVEPNDRHSHPHPHSHHGHIHLSPMRG